MWLQKLKRQLCKIRNVILDGFTWFGQSKKGGCPNFCQIFNWLHLKWLPSREALPSLIKSRISSATIVLAKRSPSSGRGSLDRPIRRSNLFTSLAGWLLPSPLRMMNKQVWYKLARHPCGQDGLEARTWHLHGCQVQPGLPRGRHPPRWHPGGRTGVRPSPLGEVSPSTSPSCPHCRHRLLLPVDDELVWQWLCHLCFSEGNTIIPTPAFC